MRLQWKYMLIINICILFVIGAFFVIDDFLARHDRRIAHINDLARGFKLNEAGSIVKQSILDQIQYANAFNPEKIEEELKRLKEERLEMTDVVDINVSYGDSNLIAASLTHKKEEESLYINVNKKEFKELKEGNIHIYGLGKYQGKSVTEIIVPYNYIIYHNDKEFNANGLIQILFKTPEVPKQFYNLRIRHLIYVIILGILLTFIVNITTDRIVIRPLEKLMSIIRRASQGKFDMEMQSYSGSEIDQVTFRLSQLLREIKSAHEKRIAALGQLAAGVAHEVKNPLNLIGMTTQYLKELFSNNQIKKEDIKDVQECLDDMSQEVEHLRKLIDQFLSLNRPRQLEIKQVDLDKLINQTLEEFTLLKNTQGVEVHTDCCGQLKNVELDPDQIRQVLQNLIQNSIQAMSKGGKIYITTKKLTDDGDYASFTIRDTGIGIPERIQERIYDAYFTTREKEGGTGLGLAITHQIVQAHSGKIELKSKEGMGASFTVILPVKQ